MKGDFTRLTFEPDKRYTGVRMQQGRVQLDADWNEQADIQAYLERTEAVDVIGRSGAPKDDAGFGVALTSDGVDLVLAPGRFYVEGVLCELDADILDVASFPSAMEAELAAWPADDSSLAPGRWVELAADGLPWTLNRIQAADAASATITLAEDASAFAGAPGPRLRTVTTYAGQPDLPGAELDVPTADRTDLVYLDVWEREVSAVEDPDLLEPALGGVDTATRVRTVWQVRVREGVAATTCAELDEIGPPPGDGVLTAEEAPPTSDPGPCLIPPGAGYRGLENRLYRVEIHAANGSGPTYKWARDNGASVFAIEELVNEDAGGTDRIRVRRLGRDEVLALAEGQFVEVLDDDDVLLGRPGTFVQVTDIDEEERILTLSAKVQGYSVDRHARARRWDGGPLDVDAGTQQELDAGIRLTFGGTTFSPGDYWAFAARTATGRIEPLAGAPPQGIRHRYAPLALVTWSVDGGGSTTAAVEDCRALFPPLTGIAAEDVAYDNAACELVTTAGEPAETVQEALDVLCAGHGLRHHNAHLHGWGIVSGVKVVCDGEDRRRAIVRRGWVIDRAGNDVEIPETTLDVMDLVAAHDADDANATKIVDPQQGRGDAWLYWSPSLGSGAERFGVEPYSADWKKELNERLLETLLMEFYEDSVKDVQEFFRRELTPTPGSEDDPVSPTHERVAALTNLFMQRVSPQSGQHILVTPREHELLQAFYEGLREELSLETFCGLFDDARPYPGTYPAQITGIDTIFGRGQHQRLKLRPGGNEAYSVGPGVNPQKAATTINRWDLKAGKLVAQINPLAAQTEARLTGGKADTGVGAVADIAFSPDGKRVYMVAPTRNGEDTMFRVGTIGSKDIDWGDVFTICDLKIVSLATTAADPTKVYGIAHKRQPDKKLLGDGIYRIDPATLADGTQPVRVGDSFNAVGHLRLAPTGEAWATAAAAGQSPTSYTGVRHLSDVTGTRALTQATIPLAGMKGSDDIAVFRSEDGAAADTVYAVVETTAGTKFLLGLRGTAEVARIPLERTAVRLEVYPPTGALLATSEDGFCVRIVDLKSHQKATNFVPMQLGPIAIAADPARDRVYVLNYLSSSLTVAAGGLFAPAARFPAAQLAAYRQAAVNAYNDLLSRFLEYLKDCLCEHLLVANPDTSAETKLYLGAISIRRPKDDAEAEPRVYKVCNLSRRRYVKSFPAVGHWLSLVPVLPFLDLLVELFCCWVMPDTFGRYAAADYDESRSQSPSFPFRLATARQGADTVQAFEALGLVGGLWGKFLEFGKIATET